MVCNFAVELGEIVVGGCGTVIVDGVFAREELAGAFIFGTDGGMGDYRGMEVTGLLFLVGGGWRG